jgi:predicted Zn-dependent protease
MNAKMPAEKSKDGGCVTRASRLAVLAVAALAATMPVAAQAQGLPVIRDAEIEQLLRDYSTPILRTAGLAQQNIRIVVINERTFNAFVADGHRIFVNTGVLVDATTPNEVIGVLAHETGHIAGGHLAKLR